ncbi:DUF58 domain-containing protein [Chitinophaga sp. Hz27]|uniref:DUF58 domain-containing protein n=1 Tax=Chitinophaga sp. Hz27 TaxID=3347169 RepID=UPI0035DF4079
MSKLLHPKTILAIKDLQLAAKTVADGFLSGMHASRMKGTGLEFSQYRSYQPSDDLRWLDWKMYARSDRYYVRQSEIETSIDIQLIVDASNSMLHEDKGITKIDYARYLAAAIGYLSHQQGDATGLSVMQSAQVFSLAARKESQHMARFYYQLEQIQPGGNFQHPMALKQLFTGPHKRQLFVFISDFYEQQAEIMQMMDTLAAMQHQVIAFHLVAENERQASFKGYQAVEDLETGELLQLDGAIDANAYAVVWNQFITQLKQRLTAKGILYTQLSLQSPLDIALRDFLLQYNKIRR